MPRDENGETLNLGDKLLGHGFVTGVTWPIGVCNGCGRVVNCETDEGHTEHHLWPLAPERSVGAAPLDVERLGFTPLDVEWDLRRAFEYLNDGMDKIRDGDSPESDLLEAHATLDLLLVRLAEGTD